MTTKPTVPDLKELFKQAAEIANQVPESMQEAAFNRAVDLLTAGIPSSLPTRSSGEKGQVRKRTLPARQEGPGAETIESLLLQIDSTQHPGVAATIKVLDRALMVLQIARSEHGVDGLTPPQIAKVLTDKFRVNTSNSAVSMALGKATNLVNRVAEGQGYKYRIMGPGEEHLAHLKTENDSPTRKPPRKAEKSSHKKKTTTEKTPTKRPGPNRKSGTRPGPKQFLEGLIANGFFKERREISSIISHIQHTHARTYKATDLSPTLIRLLREEKLDRAKNENGRYEYFSKS